MRRQVVVLVAATTTLVLVAFLVPLALLLRTLAVDRALADGRQQAQSVAALVAVTDEGQLQDALDVVNQRSEIRVGVVLVDGTRVGPAYDGTDQALQLAKEGRSFTASGDAGRHVYVAVDVPAGRAVVWAFVPQSLLRRGLLPAVSVLILLGLALLILTMLLADRLARGTVRPVLAMAETAEALGRGELGARAPVAGPPEVHQVGHALNLLAQRIGELLQAEREVVADLSHRLRTPLTRLRLDIDALGDTEQRDRLVADLDALQRQVDGVIHEARRQVRTGVQSTSDATAVVRERTSFWGVLFEDQGRPFSVDVPARPCPVRAAEQDLGAALDALLQNTFAHTPAGTPVHVSVRADGDSRVLVTVEDEGPGLSSEAVRRGVSPSGSTGLGLDIARRTAEASGGRLVVGERPGGGARLTMELGRPL